MSKRIEKYTGLVIQPAVTVADDRAGIEQNGDGMFLHLGSSRCEGTIGDIRGCKSANRPEVRLDAFDPDSDQIVFDLGLLFQSMNLNGGERRECMSGPANPDCETPFRQLGIDRNIKTLFGYRREAPPRWWRM